MVKREAFQIKRVEFDFPNVPGPASTLIPYPEIFENFPKCWAWIHVQCCWRLLDGFGFRSISTDWFLHNCWSYFETWDNFSSPNLCTDVSIFLQLVGHLHGGLYSYISLFIYIYIRSHLFKGNCICTWSDWATDSREGFAKKPTESGRQHFPPRGVRPCYQSSGLHAHGLNGYGYIYIYLYICMPDCLGDWPFLILRYLSIFESEMFLPGFSMVCPCLPYVLVTSTQLNMKKPADLSAIRCMANGRCREGWEGGSRCDRLHKNEMKQQVAQLHLNHPIKSL